jgi:chemotaxis protein histidine kinase CheA
MRRGAIVQPDQFQERLEVVRRRFASSLEGKIKDTYADLPSLSGDDANAFDAVSSAYRRIHGICGIGRAVGFAATGRAAKDVEEALLAAYRGHRGLAAEELARLQATLGVLADAAQAELCAAATPLASSRDG